MPKRHLEGRSEEARAKIRKQIGTLKRLTVQPVTRQRYAQARSDFYTWLRQENLALPRSAYHIDLVVSDYLEALWAKGNGRSVGSNALAALQDAEPHLKGKPKLSWRLMKAWVTNEVPNRAPPFSIDVLHTLVGCALFKGRPHFALSLLIGFHGLLRTGELLSLQARHMSIKSSKGPLVGKRQGAAESVTLRNDDVCRRAYQWVHQRSPTTSLTGPAHQWRKSFNDMLISLSLQHIDYRPYSLRRGGATFYFQKSGSFDQLLILGRWQAATTARVYINEGLSVLAELKVNWSPMSKNLRSQYVRCLTQPLPQLPNTKKPSQTRGRWKKSQKTDAGSHVFYEWSFQLLRVWPGTGITHGFFWAETVSGVAE